VLERLRHAVSVIHIAAHGFIQTSTIALATPSEVREKRIPVERDYMLTMDDVQRSQVHAQLVVLSCCNSGRGEIYAEGVVGMCRAFLASGAHAVVACLWSIEDIATRELMKLFYSSLQEGNSVNRSLQLAMKQLRDRPEYSEPKYWAPFFLMGEDVTIKLK